MRKWLKRVGLLTLLPVAVGVGSKFLQSPSVLGIDDVTSDSTIDLPKSKFLSPVQTTPNNDSLAVEVTNDNEGISADFEIFLQGLEEEKFSSEGDVGEILIPFYSCVTEVFDSTRGENFEKEMGNLHRLSMEFQEGAALVSAHFVENNETTLTLNLVGRLNLDGLPQSFDYGITLEANFSLNSYRGYDRSIAVIYANDAEIGLQLQEKKPADLYKKFQEKFNFIVEGAESCLLGFTYERKSNAVTLPFAAIR